MYNNSTTNCCTLYGKMYFIVWQDVKRTIQCDLLYKLQHATLVSNCELLTDSSK
jgi:hypothetical protein